LHACLKLRGKLVIFGQGIVWLLGWFAGGCGLGCCCCGFGLGVEFVEDVW